MDSACPEKDVTEISSDSDHSTKVAPTTLIFTLRSHIRIPYHIKSFHRHKRSDNRIPQNVSSRQPRDSPTDQGGLLDTNFKKILFSGMSLWRLTLRYTVRKTYKTSYIKIQQVDRELELQADQTIRIFKIKGQSGGWWWSKLSAETPHCESCSLFCAPGPT